MSEASEALREAAQLLDAEPDSASADTGVREAARIIWWLRRRADEIDVNERWGK